MVEKAIYIVELLESLAPLYLKEEWDNPGLQVGSLHNPVQKVLFSLDPTLEAVESAKEIGAGLLITHHPLIFNPLRKVEITDGIGKVIFAAISYGVTIYSLHTNLDSAPKGLNYLLAKRLKIKAPLVLDPSSRDTSAGIGRYGKIEPTSFEVFLNDIINSLDLKQVRFLAPSKDPVETVALVTGSGGTYIEKACKVGSDLLITGDLGHHHYLLAKGMAIGLLDITHHLSEEIPFRDFFLDFKELLKEKGVNIEVHYFKRDKPPFSTKGGFNT